MTKEATVLELLKATRATRVLTVLTIILIPIAYAGNITKNSALLFISPILIYSAFSIYNAHKDNDYNLPKYFPIIIAALLIATITIATINKIILIATILWIILGILYHTIARKIILGDALIAGITHFALPLTTSAILVKTDPNLITPLTAYFYLIGISIGPTTNLKDIKEDKKRKYKTLVNSTKKPKAIASIFAIISLPLFTKIYTILDTNPAHLIIPSIFLILTLYQIKNDNFKKALLSLRLYLTSATTILIFTLTNSKTILAIASIVFLIPIIKILMLAKNETL